MIVRNKEGLIKALWGYKEFTYGGHVEARLYGETYVITDYSVTILVIKRDRSVLYFDNSFYSKTTSKLQNLLKEVFNFIAIRRKAYLFDTEPKKAYSGDLEKVNITFTNEGLISMVSKKTERGFEFFKTNNLCPLVSLYIGGVWCGIETKLLRGED
ncbi:hypothetical protein [Campylobacter concisus]|uniref:Uncharacterized protein n=1 Tax=Campylobacter concisus TaxID=199 RepID=A0A1Y5MDN9_9BACT|nr:hypothetical protein [Campylobacter concisus]OUT06716.1 hypothetical protein B9N65_10620 [Campylobacter concisus]